MNKLVLLVLSFFSIAVVYPQTFVFNVLQRNLTIPVYFQESKGEVGLSNISLVAYNGNKYDTVFQSIGCSQYLLTSNEDSIVLRIFCYPFYEYDTDCALEDQDVPEPTEADLCFKITLKNSQINAFVQWNLNMYKPIYSEDSISNVLSSHSLDGEFMKGIVTLFNAGKTYDEIIEKIDSIEKGDTNKDSHSMYRNEVIRLLLPLNGNNFNIYKDNVLTNNLKILSHHSR